MVKYYRADTIYVHNLGGFDGVFIYSGLVKTLKKIKMLGSIIDQDNKFINITYTFASLKSLSLRWELLLGKILTEYLGLV